MIAVTLCLANDTEFNFECPETGTLYDQLAALIIGLTENRIDGSELLQLQIDGPDGSRGIAFTARNILSIETQPTDAFGAPPSLARTAPYVRIPDFLPQSAHDAILRFALSKEDDYTTSTVKGSSREANHADLRVRNSSVVRDLKGLSTTFEKELGELVPDVMRVLEMEIPDEFEFEIQLTAHNDGAFYKMHRDNNTPSTSARQLTFIYYFCKQAKGFSGGEIRLFDSLQDSDAAAESHIDIEPDDNSLLLFPSGVPHEVLEINCPSKAFENSRFTLNGWLRLK